MEVIVTGATRGIGAAIAAALVAAGKDVVLLVRRREAGEAQATALCATGPGKARVVVGDLGTVPGIRAAADALLAGVPRIEALVQNAAVWPRVRTLDADGLEAAFVTNHLAPWYLNQVLAPRLRESGARVVQVGAGLYPIGRVDPPRTAVGADFSGLRTYGDTKRANILVSRRQAALWEGTGVTLNVVHPGVVRTDLGTAGDWTDWLLRPVKWFWLTPERAARGPVRLVLDPSLAGVTGRWYDQLAEKPWHPASQDDAVTDALWAQAAALTRLAA